MLATSHTQIHSIFKILLLGIIFYFLEQKRGSKRLNNLFGATRLLNIDSTFIFVPSVLKFRNICLLPNFFFWERTYDAIKLIFPSPGSLTAISLSLLLGLHLICLHSAPWDQIQWFQHTFYGATLCVWLCALSTLWFLFFCLLFGCSSNLLGASITINAINKWVPTEVSSPSPCLWANILFWSVVALKFPKPGKANVWRNVGRQ